MLRRIRLSVALVLLFALVFGASSVESAAKFKWEDWGPHVDTIIMPIVKDSEARRIAFERGESIVFPGLTRPADIDKLKGSSNVELTQVLGFHMFYVCFNMRKAPLDSQVLRQAIAYVTDRDNIIRTLFKGYMLPMTSFVPQSSNYYKSDVPTYPYNPAKAKELLDKAGYKLDATGKNRIDPKTGKPLPEIKFFTPTYEVAPTSAEIGRMIAEAAQAIGIPIVPEPMDFPVMLDKLDRSEFDMYALAWGLDRDPTFLYDFFHSSFDVEAGYNRPGIHNAELDKATEALFYAVDQKGAKTAADKAQAILAEQMPYVPLYSRPYIDAWRTDLVTGYVPQPGFGAAESSNYWTPLNIRRVDRTGKPIEGGTIRWLLQEEPKNLNPLVMSSAYEFDVYRKITDSLIRMHPETLEDMPWIARKWDVGTWNPEPGKKGTVITFYLNKGVKWQDGVEFTAEDVKFSIDYAKEQQVARLLSATQDIVKTEIVDKYTVKVYFSTESYWHLYNASPILIPKHIWKDVKDYKTFEPWKEPHPKVKGLTKLIGLGPFMLKDYRPGEYVTLVKNPNYWHIKPTAK
ncbi:MAG: ABC transporter substrate-binding protein [Clostridia bacterium]|nr:ABC transporter substrate-binding protein [Clostridia bacterium]